MAKNKKKAFSLIELSIVLIIVGVIISAALASGFIITKFKISAAQSLTKNSAVAKIDNLVLWLESTLEESFSPYEAQETSSGISVWYDLQRSSATKHNATSSSSSKNANYYTNCINGLPCARFNGTSSEMDIDLSDLANNDYTIFLIEQKRSSQIGLIIGKNSASSSNTSIEIGYDSLGNGLYAQGSSSNFYNFGTSPIIEASSKPVARLHTFINPYQKNGVIQPYHYLNGSQASSVLTSIGSPNFSNLTAFNSATIGSGYFNSTKRRFNGDIGEIIIYNRALKAEERKSVEDYLLKKWHIKSL